MFIYISILYSLNLSLKCINWLIDWSTKWLANRSHSNLLSFLALRRSLLLTQLWKWHCDFASIYLATHQRLENLLTQSLLLVSGLCFSLMIIPLTGMLFQRAFLNQIKTASSRSLLALFFNFFRLEFTWPDSYASKIFLLSAIHAEMVFFFTPCFSATLFRTFSFFNFLQSFILFCYRNVYSFHLSHLFRRTSLFMEDINFVILNIRILIRSNFSEVSQGRHCSDDIIKKCHKV